MLEFKQYVRAQSLEEAYQLAQKRSNVVVGGMLWLKMRNGRKGTAIDLCDLGLDRIEENEEMFSIGAMVNLRALEQHPGLERETNGAMAEALRHIVGVQFRNVATVGGSLYGRYGFSDVLTVFLALNARVELYHAGEMSLEEFTRMPRSVRDILVRVIVPKETGRKMVYQSMRLTRTDFPVLTCCVTMGEKGVQAVIGARPGMAVCLSDENQILAEEITEESAERFAQDIASRTKFESNLRGSGTYRKHLCEVLVRRCVLAAKTEPEKQ